MSTHIPTSARTIVLQNYVTPENPLDLSTSPSGTFAVKDLPLPNSIPDDSLLVQILYMGNEPGLRILTTKDRKIKREDIMTLPLGSPFPLYSALARIAKVGGDVDEQFQTGDVVELMFTSWADYAVVKKQQARPRKALPGISLTAYLGNLGHSAATAYWALKDILRPKSTDTLVVSGAAGAVGNVAVQYAKKILRLKRVIAIAGTDEKCKWLESIGADEALNYKSATFVEDLKKATPEPVDLFFDNVGGTILDEVMMRMKPHGSICIVGAMSIMDKFDLPVIMTNYAQILVNRLSLKGFTLNDYLDRLPEAEQALIDAAVAGKLVTDGAETIVDIHGNIEEAPRVWNGLFTGANTGKLITKLAD